MEPRQSKHGSGGAKFGRKQVGTEGKTKSKKDSETYNDIIDPDELTIMSMVSSIANWRCEDEWIVANKYTLRQAIHICEVYMREKFMVVNVLSKIFADTSGEIGKTIGGANAKSSNREVRKLPNWYNGNDKGPVVDLDGDLNNIRNTVFGMLGGK